MFVQIMPEADAAKVPYHPFDLTKVWPKGDYRLIEVGYFELNKNSENYFSDVEQAAFNPAHIVPDISFSPDFTEPPLALEGVADRFDCWETEPDYFTQPGNLFRLLSSAEQHVLFENTARNMNGVPDAIKMKHIYHCMQADPAYG